MGAKVFSTRQERRDFKNKDIDLEEKILELDRFPGSLSEYNRFKGSEYEIMDTERPDKFVGLGDSERSLLKRLVSEGCGALVRYNLHSVCGPYGMPVKKK